MDDDLYSYIEANMARYVALLERLCTTPPVVGGGLALLAPIIEEAIRVGMHTTLYPAGPGLPLLYAALSPATGPVTPGQGGNGNGTTLESLGFERARAVISERPTLLLYHECDLHAPSQPTPTEGLVTAVMADRASLAARLAAIDALLAVRGDLPVQIKLLVDASSTVEAGNEPAEPALVAFVERYADGLAADACLWDVGRLGLLGGRSYAGQPVVYCGVKGRLSVELTAGGANQDVPAALGTSIPNPAWRLTWLLNSIKNDSEEILLDGFYDDMNPPGSEQNKALRNWVKEHADELAAQDEATLQKLGISSYLLGLSGFQLRLTDFYSPSISVTELKVEGGGGIPCTAKAGIEFGLVPDQTPTTIMAALREHLEGGNFADIGLQPRGIALRPASTDLTHPFTALVRQATTRAYGEEAAAVPVAPVSGPLHPLVDKLAVPAIGVGLGPQPLSRRIAADHAISEADFAAAIKQVAGVMAEMGRLGSGADWGAQARQRLTLTSGAAWQEVKIAAAPVTVKELDLDNIEGMPDFSHEELQAIMAGEEPFVPFAFDEPPAEEPPPAPISPPIAAFISNGNGSNGKGSKGNGSSPASEQLDEAVSALIAASGEAPATRRRRSPMQTGPLTDPDK